MAAFSPTARDQPNAFAQAGEQQLQPFERAEQRWSKVDIRLGCRSCTNVMNASSVWNPTTVSQISKIASRVRPEVAEAGDSDDDYFFVKTNSLQPVGTEA
jgi:hypothetical protein